MQTYDDTALLARAAANGHKLAFERPRGRRLTPFDDKTFGSRFEFYKYTPDWWGDPLHGAYHDPKAAEDIVGAEVAVADPAAVARTAAATFLGTLDGNSVVFVDDRRIDFVAAGDGPKGLMTLHLKARDRARVGQTATVANVAFRFV